MSAYDGQITHTQKYNDVDHLVDLYLDNGNNLSSPSESTRYYINPASVLSFVIEDAIANWVVDGSIVLSYLPDDSNVKTIMANYGQNVSTYVKGALQNGELLNTYQFRGDGFDVLRFRLTPQIKAGDNAKADNRDLSINPNDPRWTLSYLFSIYEVEDVNDVPGIKGPLSTYVKCIKLYFRDLRFQILRTTNTEYSTSLSPEASFDDVLTDPLNGGDSSLSVGDSAEEWDDGTTEIFYTSPAQWTAADDISYLYAHHVSSKSLENNIYDLPLLYAKRSETATDINKICLSPFSDFFENALEGGEAGKDQIEHFFVTSHTESQETSITKKRMAPFSDKLDRDLKTTKYGQIVSYSFVDMSPDTNSLVFSNTPVYSVDIGQRVFSTKFENNTVQTAKEAIEKSYISKLFKDGSEQDLFLPTLHVQKKEGNKNVFPVFSLNGEQTPMAENLRQKNGISQLLYTGLFQNTCICFSTFGLTNREVGKIIAIDRIDGAEESDYNTKLFGQWFIVKVVHSFETGAYMNLIYAVKLHRYKTAKLKFANTA